MPLGSSDSGNGEGNLNLKDLLSQIDAEQRRQIEEEERSRRIVRGATDAAVLPEGVKVEVGWRIDDYCVLSTDKDYYHAILTLLPNRPPGYKIPTQLIMSEMKSIGIKFGVREENIQKAGQFARYDSGSRIDLIVAQGRRPEHGTQTEISFHWPTYPDEGPVKKGDLLLEKRPGRVASDGCDILGRTVPAQRYEEVEVVAGDGVTCSEDGLKFYAACDGKVSWRKGHLEVVPEDRDGYITAQIAPDRLSATMSAYPPSGKGKPLDVVGVTQTLFDKGIKSGVKVDVITRTLKQIERTGEPVENIVVAEGQAPEKGKNGRLDIVVPLRRHTGRYWINADGTSDFFKLRQIDSVQEGELLARIVPPTTGREGFAVTGEKLPGIPGEAVEVTLGENVKPSEDGTEVIAASAGQVHVDGTRIRVSKVYTVNGDVDFSTGNLEFHGDLLIRGSVLDGFEVRAEGNITVLGTVGSAQVLAGGNINVGRGVLGKESGMVRAKGDLSVSFLQNATAYAGGDMHVGNHIVNSVAYARGKVVVTAGKGSIIGGRVQAGKGIEAKTIGSSLGTRTDVITAIDWEIEEKLERLEERIKRVKQHLSKLDEVIQEYRSKPRRQTANLPPEERDLIAEAVAKYAELKQQLLSLENEEREARHKLLLPLPADIIATNMLHVDVRCAIRRTKLRIRETEKCARVTYDKNTGRLAVARYLP